MTDWTAAIGAVGGMVGAVAGIGAVAVAIPAYRASKANAAAADRSAKAAETAAAEAARLGRLESDRRHEELAPSPDIKFEVEPSALLGNGHRSLMAVMEVPRPYRVRVIARTDSSYSDLALPLLLPANHPVRFEVEKLPPDRNVPLTKRLVLRFWQPVDDLDEVEPWACLCGRPVAEGPDRASGHWEVIRPMDYRPLPMGSELPRFSRGT